MKGFDKDATVMSLNPYSNGIALEQLSSQIPALQKVLILILME